MLSSACGLAGPNSSYNSMEAVDATCPDGAVHALVAIDVSGTRQSKPLSDADDTAVRSLVQRTFICTGDLQVSAFTGSVASTEIVYAGSLHLEGATETARLRREPDATDAVMNEIHERLGDAARSINPAAGGTDVLGQLGLIEEFGRQLQREGNDAQLIGLVVTDGEDTEQLQLADPALTKSAAEEVADAATVPNLDGAELSIIGIGKSSNGTIAPTPHVDALKAAWSRICERTGASQCTVVTDAANGR